MDNNEGRLFPTFEDESQDVSPPKMTGTFSLQGAGAFSLIVWVLYSIAVSRGYINTSPHRVDPEAHIANFLHMKSEIDEIHEWASHENRDGIPNWLLPQMNKTAIEGLDRKLDKILQKMDK